MAIRIEFTELGADQYVEIRDPKFLPWGVQKEITAIVVADEKNKAAQLDVAERMALALIKTGNVVSEDGVPFVFPLTESTIKNVPSLVIEKVSMKFAELKGVNDKKN